MKVYKIVVAPEAKKQMRAYLHYLKSMKIQCTEFI